MVRRAVGGGGVVFAVQPHHEVRPGSWLVKAYRITTPFWAESGKEGEEGTRRLLYSQWGGGGGGGVSVLCCLLRPRRRRHLGFYPICGASGLISLLLARQPSVMPECFDQKQAVSAMCRDPSLCSSFSLHKDPTESIQSTGGGGLLVLSSRTVK